MYQFPDTPPEAPDVLKHAPASNHPNRLKIIIVANFTLAVFILGVIWFLFFFNTESETINVSSDSSTTLPKREMTPIILEKNTPLPTPSHSDKKIQTIIPVAEEVFIRESDSVPMPLSLEHNKAPTLQKPPATSTQVEKAFEQSVEKTVIKNISTVDAIANELLKSQHKSDTLHKNNQLTMDIKKSEEKPLDNLVSTAKQALNKKDLALVNTLETLASPISQKETANKTPQEIPTNPDIYNSISLQKSSDIDKIMAAMGQGEKYDPITPLKKIEEKVSKLLNNEKDKNGKTDQYVKTLQAESSNNSKAMRTITVKDNEKLWDIAVRAYGDGEQYKKILEANPLLKEDPKLLEAGITLRIPLIDLD